MVFLTAEQTGGPLVFSLRQHNHYLAIDPAAGGPMKTFDIEQLAEALSAQAGPGQGAGDTCQEHVSLILLACMDGKLFEWLGTGGDKC